MKKPQTLWSIGLLLLARSVAAQTIQNIWETTPDKKSLLTALPSSSNVEFGSGGGGDAVISVDESTVYQTVYGFGATLTDSSALTLSKLKKVNANKYASLLKAMFNVSADANAAGMNYIRVSIGASDFSQTVYSFCDKEGDTSLSSFSIDAAPSYLLSTLNDIKSVNPNIKIHILPWSPPAWMKDSNSMNGGNFAGTHVDHMANYLLKSAQAFKAKGFNIYAISIQNEPQNENPTLPSTLYSTADQAAVAVSLRKLLDSNGMNDVKVIGFEHNWDNAAKYATQLMREDGAMDAFAGVAFHCYEGNVKQQDDWHNAFPNKELYFTECTGTVNSNWWNDIQWSMNNIFIAGVKHWAQAGLMWNFALDPDGNPKLKGASSCGDGCRGVVWVSSDGTFHLNQEYFAMGHASKAIQPVSPGGEFGKRIKVDVQGDSLVVGAYATKGASSDTRYSLVVMNSGDNAVKTAIKFQGKTATYTFPVGLTTMFWTV